MLIICEENQTKSAYIKIEHYMQVKKKHCSWRDGQ